MHGTTGASLKAFGGATVPKTAVGVCSGFRRLARFFILTVAMSTILLMCMVPATVPQVTGRAATSARAALQEFREREESST